MLIGGFVGGAVDAATGALYKYPEVVSLALKKLGEMSEKNEMKAKEEMAGGPNS